MMQPRAVPKLYADEQFPHPAVQRLIAKGFDVLTVQEANKATQKIPDPEVLAFAISQGRAVITQNRRDFIALHNQSQAHAGIVVCTKNLNWDSFAEEIERALAGRTSIAGELIRVNRPSPKNS
jgi:predicted nuclease of predicted toxin-antitoxin system